MLRDVARRARCATWPYGISMWLDPTLRVGSGRRRRGHALNQGSLRSYGGQTAHVSVFGSDYPTPDGTGMRDYLHVEDLAAAHLNALDYLRGNGDR